MEFIRNKLVDFYTEYQTHNKHLLQYSTSDKFQDNWKEDIIERLKKKINQVIMDIILLIAKSCKKENKSIPKDIIAITVAEMTVLYRAKENLQKLRYNLLNLSGDSYLDNQRLLHLILMLCNDSQVFNREIKNINYKIQSQDNRQNFTHEMQIITNVQENPQIKQGKSTSEYIISAKHKSQNQNRESFQEKRLDSACYITPQTWNRKRDISYIDQINLKDGHESEKIKKSRKKKFNYIQDFQAEQKRMRQMSKYVIAKFSA